MHTGFVVLTKPSIDTGAELSRETEHVPEFSASEVHMYTPVPIEHSVIAPVSESN